MKHLLLATVALIPGSVFADTFAIPLVPGGATVFPQGAIVRSSTTLDMPVGQHMLQFVVPQEMFYGSVPKLDVTGAKALSVTTLPTPSVPVEEFYTERQQAIVTRHDALRAQQEAAEVALADSETQVSALDAKTAYLRGITPSSETPQTLEDLQAIADFLPQALQDTALERAALMDQIREARRDLADLQAEVQRSQIALDQLGLPKPSWMQVNVTVDMIGSDPVTATLESFYSNAGWRPEYEARLTEDTATVVLDRRAQIYQNTGQGWDTVSLTLSSSRPFQTINPNQLRRDIVELVVPSKRGVSYNSVSPRMAAPMAEAQVMSDAAAMTGGPVGTFDGVAVTFDIPNSVDLGIGPSNTAQIPLPPLSLDVDVDRYANARRDSHAFVRAAFDNTTGQPILSGQTAFYRDGVLVGQGSMPLIAAGADHDLFFGPDQTLPIELRFLSELSGDQGFLARSNTREEDISFSVRNLGSDDRDVVLSYALPITVNEDIEVSSTATPRPDRSDIDGEPGVSEWDFDLQAGQSQTVSLGIKLRWPEGSVIDWQP